MVQAQGSRPFQIFVWLFRLVRPHQANKQDTVVEVTKANFAKVVYDRKKDVLIVFYTSPVSPQSSV